MNRCRTPLPASPPRGSYERFLTELLIVESGIDPGKFGWYRDNYDNPVATGYLVTRPGRALRNQVTGELQFGPMTVREYFATLGVGDLFDPASPACLRGMQYRVVNMVGFVGYQIGESLLATYGYYQPQTVSCVVDGVGHEAKRMYVGGIDPFVWRGGRTEVVHSVPGPDKLVVATHVNYWEGTFTGKNGIRTLEDLMTPLKQEVVVRDLLRSEYLWICREIVKQGSSVASAMTRAGVLRGAEPDEERRYSVSGLLAGAHLCGAAATARFLLCGTIAQDEIGTSLVEYIRRFSGYETPFD